jgi:hypothetical protein
MSAIVNERILYCIVDVRVKIPLQLILLRVSWNPVKQEHEKEPMELVQVCSQPPLLREHSSASLNITKKRLQT